MGAGPETNQSLNAPGFARRLVLQARPDSLALVLACEHRIATLTAGHVPCQALIWQQIDQPHCIESWLLFSSEHAFLAARAALDADTALQAVLATQRTGLDEQNPILDGQELRLAGMSAGAPPDEAAACL